MSIRRKMALILCAGVFLIGVGIGICFLEFSQFTYGGTTVLYEDSMVTETITLDFDADGDVGAGWIDAYTYSNIEVRSDSSVSENQIIFELTYNKESGIPSIVKAEGENKFTIDRDEGNGKDDFSIFMECKDEMLNDIKNKVATSYTYESRVICKAKLAPSNRDRIN